MSKEEEVRTAMVAAMKAKDKERKDALSLLFGALKNKRIDKPGHEDLTETEENEVVAKLGIDTPTPADKGKIMKELMPQVKGRADGKLVNVLVGKLFG